MAIFGIPGPGHGGGDDGNRTHDLLLAKQALYQLSYVPGERGAAGTLARLPAHVVALTGPFCGEIYGVTMTTVRDSRRIALLMARILPFLLVLGIVVLPDTGRAELASAPAGQQRIQAGMLDLGNSTSCVVFPSGAVNCWGNSDFGQLGRGNTLSIGDDETPASAGTLSLGSGLSAAAVAASTGLHTCVLTTVGSVKCWGTASSGRLGYGNTTDLGDDETPASAGTVNIGGTATAITAGSVHTCALLSTGAVTCWGPGVSGRLGYGNTTTIGDNETPASAGTVNIGGTAVAVAAGQYHTCALLSTGAVTCWGAGSSGRLGYGNTTTIGDDETPASAGTVNIGGTAIAVATGVDHTCVVLTSGAVKCWGDGAGGGLGYSNTSSIGDDETPATVGSVDLGGVSALATTTTVATTLPPTTTSTAPGLPTTVVTTTTTSPATTTTNTIASTVSRGKSFSSASIAKLAKITVKPGSKISLKVSAATSTRCRVTGTSVKGLRAGACRVTITVKPRTGRSTVRTVTITVK